MTSPNSLSSILLRFALKDRLCVEDNRDKFERQENLNEALSAILKFIKEEVIPEKRHEYGGTNADVQMAIGANMFREAILSKLEELGK